MTSFRRGNRCWFHLLYGFDESPRSCLENFSIVQINAVNYLQSSCNQNLTRVGNFSTPTVGELQTRALQLLNEKNMKLSTTYSHIVVGDVLELHHQHPRSTFQAASQLNCLEFATPTMIPEDGVTIYGEDLTQGPACALACASGTVYRNYFAVPPTNPEGVIGQSADSQYNTLDELEKFLDNSTHHYWTVKNGYTNSTRENLQKLNEILPTHNSEELIKLIKVGLHDDVGVVFSSRYVPISPNDDIFVTQVYCSAISCAYTSIPTTYWQPLAELLLQAQYEATIWAAVLNFLRGGTNTLFLTFVGGGVYGNDKIWIARSIGRALGIAKRNYCGLHIVICHYNRINEEMRSLIDISYEMELQGSEFGN